MGCTGSGWGYNRREHSWAVTLSALLPPTQRPNPRIRAAYPPTFSPPHTYPLPRPPQTRFRVVNNADIVPAVPPSKLGSGVLDWVLEMLEAWEIFPPGWREFWREVAKAGERGASHCIARRPRWAGPGCSAAAYRPQWGLLVGACCRRCCHYCRRGWLRAALAHHLQANSQCPRGHEVQRSRGTPPSPPAPGWVEGLPPSSRLGRGALASVCSCQPLSSPFSLRCSLGLTGLSTWQRRLHPPGAIHCLHQHQEHLDRQSREEVGTGSGSAVLLLSCCVRSEPGRLTSRRLRWRLPQRGQAAATGG